MFYVPEDGVPSKCNAGFSEYSEVCNVKAEGKELKKI
jgi:hypothetical protein